MIPRPTRLLNILRRGTIVKSADPRVGFTLIEMMIATIAATILMLTAGLMLQQAYKAWADNHDAVNLQRDAANALDLISRAVRNSSQSDIVRARRNNLILRNVIMNSEGIPHRVRFYRARNNLYYDPNTSKRNDQILLIKNAARVFIANTNHAGTVGIRLQLQRNNEKLLFNSVTAFRNQ